LTDRALARGYNKSMPTVSTISDEQRERVIEQLQAGFAGDQYEVEELERRLVLAQAAESPAALDALVTDLAPAPASTALVEAKHVRVVMGSVERRGPWDMPRRLAARVALGNLTLDLRDARIAPGTSEIDVSVTMGNLEIFVPPDVTVEVGASSFLGNVEDRSEHRTAARVIRVVGRVKLGNLEVSTLQRGESKREGHRRRRWERHARRRAMRHAYRHRLPPPFEW
jgi:cell wall-active antibiotic response 4TMS protein YvqF/uncharacterized protein DUF1707